MLRIGYNKTFFDNPIPMDFMDLRDTGHDFNSSGM